MDAASFAVPLPLALLAAAVIGALQVVGYVLVGRAVRALVEDDTPVVAVAAPVLAFALAAATAAALPPPPATAAAVATLALGTVAVVGGGLVRRHAAWRLVLADPAVAVRLEVRAAARSLWVLVAGLGVLVAAGGLGGGLATPVPGWAGLLAVLALPPLPAAD